LIGFDKKESGSKKDVVDGGFVLDRAVFQGFNQPLSKEKNGVREQQSDSNGDGNDSRKRKNPFGVSSGLFWTN